MSIVQDFTFFQGDTVPVNVTDEGIDLSGATIRWYLKNSIDDDDDTYVLLKTGSSITVTDAANGKFSFTLSSAETAALTLDVSYYHEAKITDPSGNVTTIMNGSVRATNQEANSSSILDIRFMIERYVQDFIDNDLLLHWMNDAQTDFGLNLNLPATAPIRITTTKLEYSLPADVKSIIQLWLQSDRDQGRDIPFRVNYRIYNGKIIFPTYFRQADTLNIDYYRQLKYFSSVTDSIDLGDRYSPLYVAYGLSQYYSLPSVKQKIGDTAALKEYQTQSGRYMGLKRQVIQQYSLSNPDYAVRERW